jgi:hypothetical protein
MARCLGELAGEGSATDIIGAGKAAGFASALEEQEAMNTALLGYRRQVREDG